jgi:hypothetical protein
MRRDWTRRTVGCMNESLEQRAIRDKREALETEERDALDRERLARRSGWSVFFSSLFGAAGGLVLGGLVGSALAPPEPPANPNCGLCGPFVGPSLGWIVVGAIVGFFSGLLVGPAALWASDEVWAWWRRHH